MSRDGKTEARAINTILWKDWDPIGAHVPEDEYDEFVWPTYKLLIEDAPREVVADYLRNVANEYIMCPVPEDRLQSVVDKLLALRLAKARGEQR